MNKIKKYILKSPKVVLSFVLGAIVFSIIGVKAATILAASDVIYDNSSAQATTVQGALDELYTKAAAKEKLCKHGYYTTSTGSSNYTCTKIAENQNVISLTLIGSGEQSFLRSSFSNLPDEVYVDGVSITPATTYTFSSGGEHKVVLIWNDYTAITSTSNMFYGCSSLTSLDLSNFNTSNVMNMNGMFNGCSGLTSLDLSNFDTSNVLFMNYMFRGVNTSAQIKTCDNKIRTKYPDYSYVCNN